jgi:hypothetical protein
MPTTLLKMGQPTPIMSGTRHNSHHRVRGGRFVPDDETQNGSGSTLLKITSVWMLPDTSRGLTQHLNPIEQSKDLREPSMADDDGIHFPPTQPSSRDGQCDPQLGRPAGMDVTASLSV